MYCKNCGTQLDDRAVICPHCGVPTDNYYTPGHKVEGTSIRRENTEDMPNAGLSVLSFFFPIVGLILFLVWQNSMPKRAKSCARGAILGVVVDVIIVAMTSMTIFMVTVLINAGLIIV